MAKSLLSAPHFHDETAALAYVEARLWPNGPVCPRCGETGRVSRMQGASTQPGMCKCYVCRKPFTVTVGTVMESSHVPLRVWLQAIHLLCSSKKGFSTRQLQRVLGVGLKTAWFLGVRIRAAMAPVPGSTEPLGGAGKTVEADETFLTKSRKTRRQPHERADVQVLSLVERKGDVRSMFLDHRNVAGILYQHVHPESRLVTDEAQHYKPPPVAKHETVNHSKKEYVRGDVYTNTLEGFFSIFKRGLVGIYQHIDQKHLDRYLAEFDFRQNNRSRLGIDDAQRTEIAVQGVTGKRLTYRTTYSEAH